MMIKFEELDDYMTGGMTKDKFASLEANLYTQFNGVKQEIFEQVYTTLMVESDKNDISTSNQSVESDVGAIRLNTRSDISNTEDIDSTNTT